MCNYQCFFTFEYVSIFKLFCIVYICIHLLHFNFLHWMCFDLFSYIFSYTVWRFFVSSADNKIIIIKFWKNCKKFRKQNGEYRYQHEIEVIASGLKSVIIFVEFRNFFYVWSKSSWIWKFPYSGGCTFHDRLSVPKPLFVSFI